MKNLFIWILFYTAVMALSQALLKLGTNGIGVFQFKAAKDVFAFIFQVIKNPYILVSVLLMSSSFFLWMYILSRFKLGVVFPLTALTYVFVALISFFVFGERLSYFNYFGIMLIASGVFFLLYR